MITLAFNFNFIHFPFHSTDPIPLSLDFRTLNMFLLLHNSYSILIVTNSVVLNSCVCVCVNSVFEDKVHMPTATKPTAGVHVVAPHHLGNHAAVNIEHHVHDHFAGACVCLSLSLSVSSLPQGSPSPLATCGCWREGGSTPFLFTSLTRTTTKSISWR